MEKKSHDIPRFLRYPLTHKKSHDNPRNLRNTRVLCTLHLWNRIRTTSLRRIKVHYNFLTILRLKEIFYSFTFAVEVKTSKEIPESSLEFIEKFLENNLALSDEEENTSRPLNRGGIADLPFLRTLLAIHQKPRKPSLWEKMESFVSLAYASLEIAYANY